jgi:antitoxin FitA
VLALLALLALLSYHGFVATIVIRNLDPAVKRRLQIRAAQNGRSMEAEAREVLTQTVQDHESSRKRRGGLGTAIHKRFAALGGVDLQIPPRTFSTRPLPNFDE